MKRMTNTQKLKKGGLLLAAILLLGLLVAISSESLPQKAWAAEANGFSYTVSDGEASITGTTQTGNITIPSMLDGCPVTSIDTNAFRLKTDIISVVIPNSVRTIKRSAFYGCSGLTTVFFPDGLTTINDSAFYNCSSLNSLYLPSSLESIENYAFYNCPSLESIYVEPGNTVFSSIDNCLINTQTKTLVLGCKNSVIPNDGTVEIIGEYAFAVCSELTNITIPSHIKRIMNASFYRCDNLENIVFENGLRTIGEGAFYGCSSLTTLNIPSSVTRIASQAFNQCTSLNSISIPGSVFDFGIAVFGDCTELKTAGPIGGDYNYKYGWSSSIPACAFECCSGLTSITIPYGIESIEAEAFNGCSALTDIIIPDSVTSIGDYTFRNCSGLTSVTIGNGVTSVGEGAFFDCSRLTSVAVPRGVTSIGDYAFEGCAELTSVTIPDSVTSMGSTSFLFCNELKTAGPIGGGFDIEFGWKTAIPASAFENCSSLTSVIIPVGVSEIGSDSFRGCGSLTSIMIPNSVTSIGGYAFRGTGLISVTIPDGVTSICEGTFYGCSDLTSVTIPNSVTSIINYAFCGCTGLTSVTVPDSVTSIGDSAFEECTALKRIVIPNSVTSIGADAFNACDSVLVFCDSDSYAHQYCVENGLQMARTIDRTHYYGDVDFVHFGAPLYTDETFTYSLNGVQVYNNKQNGAVAVNKVAKAADCPTKSSYMLEITTAGDARPGLGGFCQMIDPPSGGQVYYHVIVAKIPVGYRINAAHNSIGYQGYQEFLTSQEGTGKWELYIYKTQYGLVHPSAPSGKTAGHVYLTGEAAPNTQPLKWYVGYTNTFSYEHTWYYNDSMFASGLNGVNVYNNNISVSDNVSVSRITASSDCPSTSGYMLQITTNPGTSKPGLGGFYQTVTPEAGKIYYHRILAKIPKGFRLEYKRNYLSCNMQWLTPQEGTGDWQTYAYKLEVSQSPTELGTFGFLALYPDGFSSTGESGSGTLDPYTTDDSVTWYVGYSNIFGGYEFSEDFKPNDLLVKSRSTLNGHIYCAYDYNVSWHFAKALCEKMGGHLATVTETAEENVVASLCNGGSRGGYFLGATDEDAEGTWKWITGENWSYTAWYSSQPDNTSGKENYLEYYNGAWTGWNDNVNFAGNRGFICEFDSYYVPAKSIIFNNHLYTLYNESLSWSDAEAFCSRIGGHLASVTSEDEQSMITNLVDGQIQGLYWIGAQTTNGVDWNWSSGESFDYSHWGAGEPNGTGAQCAQVYSYSINSTKFTGDWNDELNGGNGTGIYALSNTGFICEIDLEGLSASKTDYHLKNKYEYYDTQLSWADANLFAQQKGGHLVTITSQAEQDFVHSMQPATPSKELCTWIGATCGNSANDKFYWVTGEPWGYTNWKTGEPNGRNGGEYYGHLYSSGLWNDCPNSPGSSYQVGFIVEYESRRAQVSFADTDGTVLSNDYVVLNEKTTAFETSRANYSFGGWHKDSELTLPWDFETDVVTEDTTLYAKWIPDSYTLTFNANGGTCLPGSKSIFYGTSLGELPVPVKNGYTFLGWYSKKNGGTQIKETDVVAAVGDRVVYACWIESDLMNCGEGLQWTLDGNKVVISGNGAMNDYAAGTSPWSKLSNYINGVEIRDGVVSIGNYAFANCIRLSNAQLPDTLTDLGEGTFSNCVVLQSIEIPESVTELKEEVFYNCTNVTSLYLGTRIEAVGDTSLDGCDTLQEITVMNPFCELPIEWSSNAEDVTVKGFTGSTAESFAGNNTLSFESLGSCGRADGFVWVFVSEPGADDNGTLTITGDGVMPDYLENGQPWSAVAGQVTKVVLDKRITYIGSNAFSGCHAASEIVFSAGLQNIGVNALEDTQWFNDQDEGIVTIGTILYAYKSMAESDSIVIGKGIKQISKNFSNIKGNQATGEKVCPESIQISSTVENIADGAFAGLEDLRILTVHAGNPNYKSINNVLYSKDGTELVCYPAGLEGNVKIPDTVQTIHPYAFAGCSALESIEIGKNVTEIGARAFATTNLRAIYGYAGSYAQSYAEENLITFIPYTSTVTLDYNEAQEQLEEKTVQTGCVIGELEALSRDGYVFTGWYYESDDDTVFVTPDFIVNEDITIYAYWEPIPEQAPVIESMIVTSLPKKTEYFVGESLNTSGISVEAVYSDGTEKTVENGFYCIPYELRNAGAQTVTVTYGGCSAEFEVHVTAVTPSSIHIEKLPKTLNYYVGDFIDPRGLMVTVEYNNGTQQQIKNSSALEYKYDFSAASDSSTVTVNYEENGVTVSTFYQVSVHELPLVTAVPAQGNAGGTVAIPIYLSGNTGIMGYVLDLTYDSAAIKPERPIFAWGSAGEYSTAEKGKLKLIWSGSEDHSENGLLVTVLFTISTKAESGTYDIGISYSEDDTFNQNYESVKLSCTDTSVTVSEGDARSTMYINDVEATTGSVFDLPILIENNVGIADMSRIEVSYDASKFEYIGYTESLHGSVIRASRTGSGSGAQVRILLNEIDTNVADGELLRLQFRALDSSAGTNDIILYLDDTNWASEGCVVSVTEEAKQAFIYSDTMRAAAGKMVEIPVYISNNPGLLGFRLRVSYDKNVFSVNDVSAGNAWKGLLEYNDSREGLIDILGTASSENTDDGILIKIKFFVKENAKPGDSRVTFDIDSESTFDGKSNELSVQVEDAVITIAGFASNRRVIKLEQFLSLIFERLLSVLRRTR